MKEKFVRQLVQGDERLTPEKRCGPSKIKTPDHVSSSDGQVCQSSVFNKFAPTNLPQTICPRILYIFFSNLPSHFSQVKFALTGPQGGEMFECKSEAESPMLGLGHFYDKAELLANGIIPIL